MGHKKELFGSLWVYPDDEYHAQFRDVGDLVT